MARIIAGLGSPHAPSIGGALDGGQAQTPGWKPLFDGYRVMSDWLAEKKPDVLIVIYNDHGTTFFFDNYPMFALSVAPEHKIADEGFGKRNLPPVAGDERAKFVAQAQTDFQDFAIIGDAQGTVEDGILVLRVDLRPADQRDPG